MWVTPRQSVTALQRTHRFDVEFPHCFHCLQTRFSDMSVAFVTVRSALMTATDRVAASVGERDTRPVAPGEALTGHPRLVEPPALAMRCIIYLDSRGI